MTETSLPPLIIGGGMAGCLAGLAFPGSMILESNPTPEIHHRAVLRFRTDLISRMTGIPFKEVTVHKAICSYGQFCAPTPLLANSYSRKVTGRLLARSIWNTETVRRWVAPDNFHSILMDKVSHQLCLGVAVRKIGRHELVLERAGANAEGPLSLSSLQSRDGHPIISTIPMNVAAKLIGINLRSPFSFQAIRVRRFRVPGSAVHQTIYFPDPETPIYRATLTGEDMIIEQVTVNNFPNSEWVPDEQSLEWAVEAFGIELGDIRVAIEAQPHLQAFGKIAPCDDTERKAFILRATTDFGVYSLGRFATWRNILLDDVWNDIVQIRKMITMHDYDRTILGA